MSFPAAIDLSTLNGINGFRIDGIDQQDQSAYSVASAGDVNGDGFDDILIGAASADPSGRNLAGESYVVFGKEGGFSASLNLATLDGSNGFIINGIDQNDNSGYSVSGAGDVNGDGFDDIVIGAPKANTGDIYSGNSGESYVVFGKSGGFSASLELASLDGTNGFRLEGIDAYDQSGRSVSSAGDVNGDGYDDVIIGAQFADPDGVSYAGESYVVFGKSGGFAASLDLSTLDGSNGFRLDGIAFGDYSGRAVASAGDVNGDGFDDIIVAAPFANLGNYIEGGETYVIFGKAGGFAASMDLANLNGSDGFRLDGIEQVDRSGTSVASAGDVNGDGFDDIVIGAPGADPGNLGSAGESYVIFGKATGFSAVLGLATLDGANGFRIDGNDIGDASGVSVAGAGDVNGDGFADIIIGASGGDPGGISTAGESYVVYGKAGGFSASIALSELDGTNGFRIDGIDTSDLSGSSVAGAGDVNGDGFADILVGAFVADPGGVASAGESYVIFGIMPQLAVSRTGSDIGQFISGGLGNDTIDGRGGEDVLLGQIGDDEIQGGDGNDNIDGGDGEDAISGGAGNDTLRGGLGDDTIIGGSGDDEIDGGAGFDIITAGSGNDALIGANGNDTLIGNVGDDSLKGGNGDDILIGGDGADIASGNAGNDNLIGDLGNDVLRGGSGVDSLNGGDDDDRLEGGTGDDELNGGSGNDFLVGGGGGDTDNLRGSLGDDTYQVQDSADVVEELANQGSDLIRTGLDYVLPANVERLVILASARNATGNGLDNTIVGTGGGDSISGLDGADTLRGGSGLDTILGGSGIDRIDGGAGKDTMTGGADKDTFEFRFLADFNTTRATADVITDFDKAAGEKIQINLIDANTNTVGDDDFEWIASNAFSGTAGELRFQQVGSSTFVEGDVNGDGVADLVIKLNGLIALTSNSFIGVRDLQPNREPVDWPGARLAERMEIAGADDWLFA